MTSYAGILFLTIPGNHRDGEQPTLEDDVSSFNATLESCEHEEVVKRVLDSLVRITDYAMQDLASNLRSNMWHLAHNYNKETTMKWWKLQCNYQEHIYTGFTLEYLTEGEDYLLYLYGFMKIIARVTK